jgi:hypothetical protein
MPRPSSPRPLRSPLALARAFPLAAVLALAAGACDAHPAGARVDDAFFVRQADGTWAADVDVTGYATTGGDIGGHCVSVHYFPIGANLAGASPAPTYFTEYELAYQCFQGGLRDGDTRRVHFVTKRNDIPSHAAVRAQVLASGRFDVDDTETP